MDKSAIKNFAVSARVKLKEQIEQKAYSFGITKNDIKEVNVFEDTFEINGKKYNKRLFKHRESLINKINEEGFEQVLEEAAYTWFNRFIAIRFMEVNEYLPSGVRVLSSTDSSKAEPDIIREAANLDFENLNIDLIYKLQDENNTEELFKYLLIKQCNELGKIMPVVFEEIEDYTELLLPDNLLQESSIIRDLVTSITEDDWKEQVEIIGWLYQYYISEKKDEVFADLKKNKKITKENIPAATQLFTPDWIVKYMVENSLGRLWLESHPDDELMTKWKYYLEEAEQEPEVMKQLQIIRDKNKDLKPEDIKLLDPCMGSGHILVYAFDVLFDIYKSAGYSEREIPKLILEKNLCGLDIDDRAAQLAYFAVMMKARSYNRRIFREKLDLNICSIQESNGFPKEAIDFFSGNNDELKKDVEYLVNVFDDAKEYGSILDIKEVDFSAVERRIEEIRNGDTNDIFEWQYKNIIMQKIPLLVNQAEIMSKKYDAVVTNPPYMGNKGMNEKLSQYINNNYDKQKSDLFSVFIVKCIDFSKYGTYIGMITMQSWLTLKSFEQLRLHLIDNVEVNSLIQIGYNSFPELNSQVAHAVTFIFQNIKIFDYRSKYMNLNNGKVTANKEQVFFERKDSSYFINKLQDFSEMPQKVFGYWASTQMKKIYFELKKLSDFAEAKQGLATSDNGRFLRLWYEVNFNNIGLNYGSREDAVKSNLKWFPYNKGGEFRRWYGNNEYIINWENDGFEIKNLKDEKGKQKSRPQNLQYMFKECITWSKIAQNKFAVRYQPKGFLFDVSGCSIFSSAEYNIKLLGLLNSSVIKALIDGVSPTINYEVGTIENLPVCNLNNIKGDSIQECIKISRQDWDTFETSWGFKIHPLLKHLDLGFYMKLNDAFNIWQTETKKAFKQLKYNEEELNRIFIEIYGLQDELKANVEDKDITLRNADRVRDIKSFISYSVGCMFGRYSLDEEGLIYAGGQFNLNRYKTFKADVDNVIPITDDEYFEDDIVSRFVEFVRITFSEETLEENLDFVADTLGKKGNETSRQTIRRYFLKDFYKDHVQTYQKRPIYWLFDSGKKDGFKALIYMHRYDVGTVARVRTDYLHLLQRKYEAEVNRLDMVMGNSNASAREKTEARKKKEKIQKQILECVQYDQVIAHVANQKIVIDLDDGVAVNYGKFQGVEVPQGEGKKPLKADLLAKI